MKNQKGFSLIGVLLAIGTLLLTAGGVMAVRQVWKTPLIFCGSYFKVILLEV
ncbi:MAG: prepilin-type N-terminal cleavage/methylation domain-containing protein [Candidatus Cloacimonetes bacterium]|nr:prepilin-type N-terminal cleavage/methylation domain-containing protein [Candidatus Cloacimonadota bacterium]